MSKLLRWNERTAEQKAELVAKVMGWHKAGRRIGDDICETDCWFLAGKCGRFPHNQLQYTCGEYRPTENIAQAWEAIEHLEHLVFTIIGCFGHKRAWSVGAGSFPGVPEQWVNEQPSAADAICHAAVLAMEGKDDADSN